MTIPPAKTDDIPKTGIQQVKLAAEKRAAPKKPAPAVAVAVPRTPPEPPAINDDPDQLLGLAPTSVAKRLGSPGFVRRDGPAEIWQYPAEACVLDIFLYRTGETLAVAYVELRGRGAATTSRRACFVELLKRGAGKSSGAG